LSGEKQKRLLVIMKDIIPLVDLKEQYRHIEKEIGAAFNKLFKEGRFILGENVERFEEEFSSYNRVKFCVGVGSGTEALHLSLVAAGVKPGDEVITQANTAFPTVTAILLARGKPVFVDIDPCNYNMNVKEIEGAVTKKTKVILPVHLFGYPTEIGPIMDISRRYGLCVIEDACQAHGALYKSKKVGTFGDMGCFSFYPTKNLGAYGDGGAVLTNSPKYYTRLRLLRNYGQKDRYHHDILGFNSRLDEIQAAVLRIKLKSLDKWNKKRRIIAKIYTGHLDRDRYVLPEEKPYVKPVYHLYVIRAKNRERLRSFLKGQGIETQIHYPIPVHKQKAYYSLGLKRYHLPITERYSKEIISLPIFPELSPVLVKKIAKVINMAPVKPICLK